jgi:hypothetical protein
MSGGVFLLVATTPYFNTIPPERRPATFAWSCGTDETSKPDLYQILVYPLSQESGADSMFASCNERMSKVYHEDHVIYSHSSLDDRGVFHSGVGFLDVTISLVFHAGLLLYNRGQAKELFNGVIADNGLKWHQITPNDLLENCFDGYSLVKLQGLRHLKVIFNDLTWLDLGPRDLEYLQLAGQKYFPLIIQPTRLDVIKFTVRWEQSTHMEDIDDEIHTDRSPDKLMKYFYNNQNNAARHAAYEKNGMPAIFPPAFRQVIYEIKHTSAVTIQRWWADIYYNPFHRVGRRVVMGAHRGSLN